MLSWRKACFAAVTAMIIAGSLCGCRREDGEIGSRPESSGQPSMTTSEPSRPSDTTSGTGMQTSMPNNGSSENAPSGEDRPGSTAFGNESGRNRLMP